MESRGFEISCKECGARGKFGLYGSRCSQIIGLLFDKETPNIQPRMTVFCNKCGSRQTFGMFFPIDHVMPQRSKEG
jgi:DNA-directed RNA polymerase subunit RPC12/RpoP